MHSPFKILFALSLLFPTLTRAAELSWVADIKPDLAGISVTGTLHNAKQADIAGWQNLGMITNTAIRVKQHGDNLVFHYSAPVDQEVFFETFDPVYNDEMFCGFGQHLLVFPHIKDRHFHDFSLTINTPPGWTLVTSRGVNTPTQPFTNLDDLRGTMICAGDYTVEEFDLPNKNRDKPTHCILALHGERDFKDRSYFDHMKRMMQAQTDYFGGDYPADTQCIALHVLGKGIRPSIPAFNRRAPGHVSMLGLHTPERPWGHFEFFGMLSHEHMHNWFPNVLRSDLGPWFMEGLNDYVAYRILYDSKLHSKEQYNGMLNKWYREYLWCVKQSSTPLMPYRRGMIAAWVFDLEIQRATEKKKGLKDLLLHLLENTPKEKAVSRAEFIAALKSLIGARAETLYTQLIESEEAIELANHLDGSAYAIDQGEIRITH